MAKVCLYRKMEAELGQPTRLWRIDTSITSPFEHEEYNYSVAVEAPSDTCTQCLLTVANKAVCEDIKIPITAR